MLRRLDCEIAVFYEYHAWPWLLPVGQAELANALCAMRQSVAASPFELWLICDQEIAVLNRRFLGVTGPTNILTFPDPGGLFLSLDTLAREAWLYQQDRADYLLRLLAHGLGHLAGLDHCAEMAEIEETAIRAGAQALKKG